MPKVELVVDGIKIKTVEEMYGAKYVGQYDLPEREGPFLVFYTENPDRALGHDNYFGIFRNRDPRSSQDSVFITSAATIRNAVFPAIELATKEFLVSRYRHDFVGEVDGGAFIDGGLAYTRYNPNFRITHNMTIVDGAEVFTPIAEKAT